MADSFHFSGQNKYLTTRLFDHYHPKPKDNRSAEKVVVDIFDKCGLTFGDPEEERNIYERI